MSEQKTSSILTALQALFFIVLLLVVDTTKLCSDHLIFPFMLSVCVAEILLLIALIKGEICNGQRGRLTKLNHYFALYWGYWFISSIITNISMTVEILTSLLSLFVCLLIGLRRAYSFALWLSFFVACLILSSMVNSGATYGVINAIAYILVGVIMANVWLVLARNRLQGFIALMPIVMVILLILNVLVAFITFLCVPINLDNSLFSFMSYFVIHLLVMAIVAFSIWHKRKLSYRELMILFLLSGSLPILLQTL